MKINKNDSKKMRDMIKQDLDNWDSGVQKMESIFKAVGLEENLHYLKEKKIKTESLNNQKPDYILKIPGDKCMIIDSNVSVAAYENYCNADNKKDKKMFLEEHLKSINTHITTLSNKNYQDLDINQPDYILMFMADEPAFKLAILEDITLFNKALDRNVVVVTDSTLFSTLKVISSMWEKDKTNDDIKKDHLLDAINKNLNYKQSGFLKKIIDSHYESEIIKLSKQAESKNLELKSSFRTDIEKGGKIPPETLINEVLKTICGFCNTSGGDLLIGVNDNNEIIGIEVDGYKNTDKFILTLENHIKDYTKPNILLLPDIISITYDKYEGKTVCRVNVLPCKEHIFLNYKNNKGLFYMRTGAATQRLEGREMIKYVEKKKEKYND